MKSYFAKLAARATLANVPVPSSVTSSKPHDPFEGVASTHDATPPVAGSLFPPPIDNTTPGFPQSLVNNDERFRGQPDRIESITSEDSGKRSPRSETPKQSTPTTETTPETRLKPDSPGHENRLTALPRDLVREPEHESKLNRKVASPSGVLPSVSSQENDAANTRPAARSDRRERETRLEQSNLLRKADAFMAALFEPRPAAPHRESDSSEDHTQVSTPRAIVQSQEPSRLQAAPKSPQINEPIVEQPSLVIGKLTVEVMPPAPPPITQPPRVIVVRGGGSARRGAIQSSQRFGFSQF